MESFNQHKIHHLSKKQNDLNFHRFHFNLVCEVGVQQSKEYAESHIGTARFNLCVNTHNGRMMQTPVEFLALKGEHEAVEFLLDHFNADANSAVYAYAQMGDMVRVENLIKYHGASLHFAAAGYELSGNHDAAENLFKRGASLDFMVKSAAMANNGQRVDALLKRGANLGDAILGYAQSGNVESAEELISLGGSQVKAIYGYALKGLNKKVNEMIKHEKDLMIKQFYLDAAAKAYAYVGDVWHVEKMIFGGAKKVNAVEGYALAGYYKELNELLRRDDEIRGLPVDVLGKNHHENEFSAALLSCAYGGHDAIANLLIRNNERSSPLSGYHYLLAEGYAQAGNAVKALALQKSGVDYGTILHGYGIGANLIQADKMLSGIRNDLNKHVESVVSGYHIGRHLVNFSNRDTALQIISQLSNKTLRKELVFSAHKHGFTKGYDVDQLLEEAKAIYSSQHDHGLSHKIFALFKHKKIDPVKQHITENTKRHRSVFK